MGHIFLDREEFTPIGKRKPSQRFVLKFSPGGKGPGLKKYYELIDEVSRRVASLPTVRGVINATRGSLYFLEGDEKVIVQSRRGYSRAVFSGFDPTKYRGISSALEGGLTNA